MTAMAMEGAYERRLRLNFEDPKILTKTHKKLGLKRSWLLLQPHHHTINDVISHILHSFDLLLTCPFGIVLTMDGFVLPPFESTIILNDKDLISVKRKASCSKAIEESTRPFLENGIVEKLPSTSGVKLLTNEEFDKENGGDIEKEELARGGDVALKKRKASSPIESSKKKRPRQAMSKSVQKDINHCENINTPKKKRKLVSGSNGEIIAKCTNNSEPKSNELVESQEVNAHAFIVWEGTKKVSRSTRRKSINRRLKRIDGSRQKKRKRVGGSKTSNDEGQDKKQPPIFKLDKVSGFEKSVDSKIRELNEEDSDEDDDLVPVEVRPGHIVFTSASKVKDVQNRKEGNGLGVKEKQEGNGGVVQKTQETNGWDVQLNQKGALVDNSAQNTVYDANKNKVVKESFCWNGITNKRKGQKWGKEKPTPSWKDSRDYNGSSSNGRAFKKQPRDHNQMRPKDVAWDFQKLMPLTDSPKVGDVIAYRLLELSSSWCPELSSFRVGKITSFNQETNNIVLVPEEKYPLNLEKKIEKDNDDDDEPPQPSVYKEDGSLEIDFPSLVEVRMVKSSDSSQLGETGISAPNKTSDSSVISKDTNQVKDGSMNGTLDTVNKDLHAPTTPANGTKDVWEEISEVLSAKKAQLEKEDNWNKKESSTKRSWSHRTLKSSAIGPTMAMLRSQNGGLNNNP